MKLPHRGNFCIWGAGATALPACYPKAGSKFSGRRRDEFGLIKVRSTQAHSGL
jgi:hypothetical protein